MIETLAPGDFDEWVEHCGSVFDDGPAYFRRHFLADPHRDFGAVFVAKEDGQIVSTVRVFRREVWLGGRAYKMGGIGEVSTNAEYRRRGLSGMLLDRAVAYMEEQGFALSSLGAGYFSHYEKHGYLQVRQYWKTVSGEQVYASQADIRPLNADNYRDMCALYDKYSRAHNFSVLRSLEYFRSWSSVEMKNPLGLFRSGRLAGYICCEGNLVTELIADGADHEALLCAAVPQGNIINVPSFAKTKRRPAGEWFDDYMMIRVNSPVECGGEVFTETARLAAYLNENGGIRMWRSDGF